ncbi:MAG: hypothetical protein IPM29_17845 [Planctomycetes bacterium]|nr:hypothetical protein [Planctomycetota bacterium]
MDPNPPPLPRALARQVFDLAMEWYSLRPWESFDDTQMFGLRLGEDGEPLLVSTLGAAGEVFGLVLYRGDRALDAIRAANAGDRNLPAGEDGFALTLDIAPVGSIPEPLRDLLRASGRSTRLAPACFVYDGRRPPRPARKSEYRLLAGVLRAVNAALRERLVHVAPIGANGPVRVPTLVAIERGKSLEVRRRTESFAPTGPAGLFDWPAEAAARPQRDVHWIVGRAPVPVHLANDERQPVVLLALDARDGIALLANAMLAEDLQPAVEAVYGLMIDGSEHTLPGRPRRITFADRELLEAMSVGLAAMDVATDYEPEAPLLADAIESFVASLGGAPRDEPDEWSEALSELREPLEELDEDDPDLSDRAWDEFFGGEVPIGDDEPDLAFDHWRLLHATTRGFRTFARHVHAFGLTPAARELLDRLTAARLSVFRLRSSDGLRLRFEDLLDARPDNVAVVVESQAAAATHPLGSVLIGRFCEFRGVTKFLPLAPLVLPHLVDRTLGHLRELGMELDHDGIARDAHLCGRLFPFVAELEASPATVTNTDGDPLELQRATFAVRDFAALGAALASRPDIEPADHDDGGASAPPSQWVWFGEARRGQRSLLARLEHVGDQLLVEVDSRARLERVRAWLESIPGVRFVRSRELDGPPPLDDALGAGPELTPESREEIMRVLEQYMLAWVDEPIPALDGRTPREAVRDPDGRRRVELLIRTMPDPGGIPGLRAPREAIRRELGLD